MKSGLTALVGILPSSRIKNFLLRRLGHLVPATASIGPVLIVGGTSLDLGEYVRIGPFNVFRGLSALRLGAHAEIGQWNWISAAPFLVEASDFPFAGQFALGEHSSFTSRHYADASGGVLIEEFVTIAGVRSVFMSHGIDATDNVLDTAAITVGKYAMVGGNCNFVLGASVPEYSIVAMGSLVIKGLDKPFSLYAGSPAKYKKAVEQGAYFSRRVGAVPPRARRSLAKA